MNMIQGKCRMRDKAYRAVEWPVVFAVLPEKGQMVEGKLRNKAGKLVTVRARVRRVIHSQIRRKNNLFCSAVPIVKIDLMW